MASGGTSTAGTLVQAKGHTYRLAELLGNEELARVLTGGHYATIYLSPADYHRVHAPIDGEVVAIDHVPGSLFPVKPVFTRNVEGLFARNERAVIHMQTAIGPAAVVMVAAIGVAHLQLVHAATPARRERRRIELDTAAPVRRGDELGAFLLGSTVVVVVPEAGGPIDAQLAYLSVTLSHPRWLVERWLIRYGFEHVEAWCQFNNSPPAVTISSRTAYTADIRTAVPKSTRCTRGPSTRAT